MSAAATTLSMRSEAREPVQVTLLQLVGVVSEITDDEREVVATVLHMLRSGSVALCGNFRGSSPEDFA